jgi:hypothetical protein
MRSKMFTPTRAVRGIEALLPGEAASFVEIWRSI